MTITQFTLEDILSGVALTSILLILSVTDLRRGILPNAPVIGVFGLLQSVLVGPAAPLNALLGALSCATPLFGLAAAFHQIRGTDGLGLGDIKFGAAAGLWLGWEPIPWMLLIASILALVFILARALWRGRLERPERTALGSFFSADVLVIGASGHFY